MTALRRLAIALMWLSVIVTAVKLSGETTGDWLFTLIGLILLGTAAPYLISLAVMRRVPARWGLALGSAVCVLGGVDVAWRLQAFFYPTESSNAAMGFWLPVSSVWAIPCATVIAHTCLKVFAAPRTGAPSR